MQVIGSVTVRKYRHALICLFLATAICAVYWQVQFFELIDYDDISYITQNRHVKAGLTWEGWVWALGDTHTGYWHPITWLSHMLDYQLFRNQFGGHHWSNVILHIINTLLLYLLFRKLTGEVWKSAFVAFLFALHPLNVESVAWVAERKNVLSTLFLFAGIWLYSYYVMRPDFLRYSYFLLCFVLGLMTKPILVIFPFLLLLFDYWPLGRLNSIRVFGRLLWEKVPLFVLSAVFSVWTFLAGRHEGSVITFEALPLSYRIENALVAYVRYMGKMFWPEDLAVFYPYEVDLPKIQVAGAAVILGLISVSAIIFSQRYRYTLVGWLWYLGTLVPVIGLIQSGEQAMADRYAYISLIGLFVVIVWGMADMYERCRHREVLYVFSSVPVIIALMVTTWFQVGKWRDSATIFRHALEVTRGNYLAHNNLGVALLREGKVGDAVGHFKQAIHIKRHYSEAHTNLGMVLADQGNLEEAIAHYEEALKGRADNEKAYNNLGIALARKGRLDEAMNCFREALRKNPDYADALNNMGSILAKKGDVEESLIYYERALQLDPDNAMAHHNLGMALSRLGEFEKAISHFDEALRLNPCYREAFLHRQEALKRTGTE